MSFRTAPADGPIGPLPSPVPDALKTSQDKPIELRLRPRSSQEGISRTGTERVTRIAAIAILVLTTLAATPLVSVASAVDLTGGIVNLTPSLVSVTLSSSSLTPTAGTTTTLTVTVIAADGNGFNDISGITVEILKPDGTTSHIAAAAATFSSGNALQATYARTVNMNFYDAAATIANSYKVKVIATDTQSAAVNNIAALTTFNYAQLAALNAGSALSLGASMNPGDTGSTQSLSIQNYGNVQIDVQTSGTTMSHGTLSATIPVGSLSYSLNSDMSSSSALTTSAATLSAFDLATGASSSKTLYWRLAVPSASTQYVPAGTYTSVVTLSALAG